MDGALVVSLISGIFDLVTQGESRLQVKLLGMRPQLSMNDC